MNYFDDEPNRFKPVALFQKCGVHKVFYKGDAPKAKETEHEKALAQIASQKWDYYQKHYRPIEDAYMKEVDSMDSEGAQSFIQGAAAGATKTAFSEADDQLDAQLEATGANPNSGRYKSKNAGLRDAEGTALTKNITKAGIEQQDQHITGIRNVAMIGRGEATNAQAGLSDLASLSHREAVGDARNALAAEQSRNYAAGAVLGAGARAYGEYKDKNQE